MNVFPTPPMGPGGAAVPGPVGVPDPLIGTLGGPLDAGPPDVLIFPVQPKPANIAPASPTERMVLLRITTGSPPLVSALRNTLLPIVRERCAQPPTAMHQVPAQNSLLRCGDCSIPSITAAGPESGSEASAPACASEVYPVTSSAVCGRR